MNTQISADFGLDCGARSELPNRGASLAQLLDLLRLWRQRHRQRQALARLDEHLLRDIGLDRRLALREAAKPFWQA